MEVVDENVLICANNKSKDMKNKRKSTVGVIDDYNDNDQLDDNKSHCSTSSYNTDTTSESTVDNSVSSTGNSDITAAWDSISVSDLAVDNDMPISQFADLTNFNFDNDNNNSEIDMEDDSFLDRLAEYLINDC